MPERSRKNLEALLDALPLPALTVDGDRRITAGNDAARRIFGDWKAGCDLAACIRQPDVLENVHKAIKTGKDGESEIRLSAAIERVFRVTVSPLPDFISGGKMILMTFSDLTLIRETDRVRSSFVANVSHELRSPLTTIAGCIETLQTTAREDPDSHQRFLDLMSEEARRMTRLVDDLLSLSRLEVQEHIQPSGAVDICKLLEQVMDNFSSRTAAQAPALVLDCPGGADPVIGEPVELIQVFDNLVENAIKYGQPGEPVRVSCAPVDRIPLIGGKGQKITVTNTGEPIPPEHLPRLTERFYRVDAARSRHMGGTGLGLSIVKHIINRHRGHLTITSSKAKGTVIAVYLPIIPQVS